MTWLFSVRPGSARGDVFTVRALCPALWRRLPAQGGRWARGRGPGQCMPPSHASRVARPLCEALTFQGRFLQDFHCVELSCVRPLDLPHQEHLMERTQST